MAGSYRHVVDDDGRLRDNEAFLVGIENLGDAYEAVEEMYGMVWWLADGDAQKVRVAEFNWDFGISEKSPARDVGLDEEEK